MYLGIVPSNDGRHHDPSACLVDNGDIVAFVEEERMIREKHAKGEFPINAVEECLDIASADLTDVDAIGLSRNYDNRRKALGRLSRRSLRSDEVGIGEKLWDTILLPVRQTVTMTNDALIGHVTDALSVHFDVAESDVPPVSCLNHQLTHAASTFYPSGFDDALIVSLDNYGGHLSGAIYVGTDLDLDTIETFPRFNSLGRFFSDITAFLGFRRSNGEGKVMGLAPYGEENDHVRSVLEGYVTSGDGRYDTEPLTYRKMGDAVSKLERDLGVERRYWRDDIEQIHKDVAYHAQRVLERVVTDVVAYHLQNVDTRNVCLAGGVALNCKMNRCVRELSGVDDLFVQPAANDAGGSLGAACELANGAGHAIQEQKHVYLGSRFTEEEIDLTLEELKLSVEQVDDVVAATASALEDGALVGWFQGRMEGGPRALGNRSILADPRTVRSRDDVNRFVKHREDWRPFAPSMLREDAEQFLRGDVTKAAHFMIDTYETTPVAAEEIPAVLHPADETTRPQVVTEDRNERYYHLLRKFKARTGVGVLLNTSFNDSGEPIVRTPAEAIRDFYSMGLDLLVMGDTVLTKESYDLPSREARRQGSENLA